MPASLTERLAAYADYEKRTAAQSFDNLQHILVDLQAMEEDYQLMRKAVEQLNHRVQELEYALVECQQGHKVAT